MISSHDFSLLSKTATGFVLLVGLFAIFVLHMAFFLPFSTTGGLVVAFLICVTFLHRPLWGFLAIVVIRASVDFLDSYFSLPITENISLNIASLLALTMIAMLGVLSITNFQRFKHTPLLYSFGAFILFSAFSITYSIDQTESFQETLRVISIFATFVIGHFFCISLPHARTTIISTILFASILPISFALYQLSTGAGFSDNTGTDGRLFGTFKHPNSFASFLVIVIALLTYRAFMPSAAIMLRKSKIPLLILTITLLILTFSRGGWLALIIFFGIFTLLRAPKILFLSITVGIFLFFISPAVHDRIEDIYNPPADSSIRWRFQQWQNAIGAWKNSPIYGYGTGTEIAIHEKEQGFYAGNPYTHNDVIKVLQETGVIGLVLYMVLICVTFMRLILARRSTSSDDDRIFIFIVILLFLAEIGFGMSSNIWRGTAVQWFLWLLIACALSLHVPHKKLH